MLAVVPATLEFKTMTEEHTKKDKIYVLKHLHGGGGIKVINIGITYAINHSAMEFLAVKACYLFSVGSKYTLMAFLVVFLTGNGLNVPQAGQITTIRYSVEVIGAVVLNVLTDRFKKYAKIILMIYITNSSVMIKLMPWITYTWYVIRLLRSFKVV